LHVREPDLANIVTCTREK